MWRRAAAISAGGHGGRLPFFAARWTAGAGPGVKRRRPQRKEQELPQQRRYLSLHTRSSGSLGASTTNLGLHTLSPCSAGSLRGGRKKGLSSMSAAASKEGEPVRSTTASGSAVYESSRAVDEYLQFHFGRKEDLLPYSDGPHGALNFPARCAALCEKAVFGSAARGGEETQEAAAAEGRRPTRALDVGCAVGGASFELSKAFDEVVGVDFSQHFVDAAQAMKASGCMEYQSLIEGSTFAQRTASLPLQARADRCSFYQGDACNLSALEEHVLLPLDTTGSSGGGFDVVLASNLLCRLPRPRAFLASLSRLVRPGGVAVIVSPYSWLEEYTAKEEWLGGGGADGGGEQGSFSALERSMTAWSRDQQEASGPACAFTLESRTDMPFLIREHSRKFQWGLSDATVWRRQQ